MPHYDYKCNDCGYSFELFQKMKEDPLMYCPACGGQVKRLIGKGAGPIFKGSGFYQTDYKNNNPGKETPKKELPDKPAYGKKDSASPEVSKKDKAE